MKLLRYLGTLGYGTRRVVERLLSEGRVTTAAGVVCTGTEVVPSAPDAHRVWHAELLIDGVPLDPPPGAVVMLHKPAGYVCSTRDTNPLVYDLLPARFQHRSPIVAPVGRLDRDTTGLLLLTDNGQLLHRLTSPRAHLPKVYRATLAQPLRGDEAELFASGAFMLESESKPLAPARLTVVDETQHLRVQHAIHQHTHAHAHQSGEHQAPIVVRVTITEGRYHQVRRMFAALGNHVTSLHRESVGPIILDNLPLGAWRVLAPSEVAPLTSPAAPPSAP